MASKGQKFNSFSNEFKLKVVEEFNSGLKIVKELMDIVGFRKVCGLSMV